MRLGRRALLGAGLLAGVQGRARGQVPLGFWQSASVASAVPMLPNGARVAMLGDSIIQFNHQQSASSTNASLTSQGKGEVVNAQMADPRFRCDVWISGDTRGNRYFSGANQGLTGDTVNAPGPSGSPNGAAGRVTSDILPLKPDVCVVAIGTNNVGDPGNMSGIQSICATLLSNGIQPILCTVRPWPASYSGHTVADQTSMLNLNAAIRSYCAATAAVILCDLAAAYGCPGPAWAFGPSAYFNDSDLHPSDQGGWIGGQALSAAIAQCVAPGNWFVGAYWNAGTNLVPTAQAIFTGGNGGGKYGSVSGDLPTGYNLYSNPASTNVLSIIPNSVTGGNSIQMVITPNSSDTNPVSWPLSFATAPTATPGSYVFAMAEVEFDAWPFWGGAAIQLSEVPGSANQASYGMSVGTPVAEVAAAGRRWLISPPLLLDSAETAVGPQVTVWMMPNGASGTGTFKVHRFGVFPTPRPQTAWNS